jgi:hypothetical protein
MSLLSGATAWTNDDAQPKKRVSTMRKSLKSAPEVSTEIHIQALPLLQIRIIIPIRVRPM